MSYIDEVLTPAAIHRIAVTNSSATTPTRTTVFNGQTYAAADYIPIITGVNVTTPGGTFANVSAFVESWVTVGGNWALDLGLTGFSTETFSVTLAFFNVGAANIARFGGI
jgi:hypothetical protein